MIKRILFLASAFVFVALLISILRSAPVSGPELTEVEEQQMNKPGRTKGRAQRSPASVARSSAFKLKESDRKFALEKDEDFRDAGAQVTGAATERTSGYVPMEQRGPLNRITNSLDSFDSKVPANDLAQASGTKKFFSNQGFPPKTAAPTAQVPKKSSGSSSTVSTPEPLSCSASIGAGTYSSPRSVTLSCSSSAEIRYCLQENVYCDPSAGAVYTGAFTVGATVGDFYLSIQGENNEGPVVSDIVQLSLQFNPDVPHLVVDHQRRYWQTGQLSAAMSFVSNNFGSPNLEAGILNLITHDPSPAGLNMTCEQIVENYTTLTTPAPLVVLPGMSVDALNPSLQLDAWLSTTQLSYGDNHVTTYLKNNNYGSESFACSTTKLVVEDFDFFTAEAPAMVDAATLDGSLIGGFSTYGHFEEDVVLNRTPAGSMINNRQDQELRTGMIGIFY